MAERTMMCCIMAIKFSLKKTQFRVFLCVTFCTEQQEKENMSSGQVRRLASL